MQVTAVLGIPGRWPDPVQLLSRLDELGFVASADGQSTVEVATGQLLPRIEIAERDPHMRLAIEIASGRLFAPELYDAIGQHTMTAYVVDEDGGSVGSVHRLAQVAEALLDAGGLAVKVESAGVAHAPSAWRELVRRESWVRALVACIVDREVAASCGMHLLGLRDAVVDAPGDIARNTLDAFLCYAAYEAPLIEDGHTFSVDADALRYQLHAAPDTRYPSDTLFHNPFGFWELRPVRGIV